jgi:predicted glycogen debranching enzyme
VSDLPPLDAEWLEADGAGGFSSGTVAGYRTRRYHALLLTARQPPSDRVVLVNGFEAWVELRSGNFPLSTQHYLPDVLYPRGLDHISAFTHEPWPQWTYRSANGVAIVHECIVDRVDGSVVLVWRLAAGGTAARLNVRLLLSGRDYHALMRENTAFAFEASVAGGNVTWRPYSALPAVTALTNGSYEHGPTWYRNFLYREEAARGLDHVEDLASPGAFSFDLSCREAIVVLRASDDVGVDAEVLAARAREHEATRRKALVPLDRAAEAYIVHRGRGHSIIAGYPWFTDWGRDTFIAMRGLVLARGRYDIGESILLTWAEMVSKGMLPNGFPDQGDGPEFNAVDASLWYVIAVYEFLAATGSETRTRQQLVSASAAILDGYAAGTRYGIRMDTDGLIACGVPGMQLTWMDAKVGDRVVTPRIGKPVEVQALWINALRSAGGRYAAIADRACASFRARFWNASAGCLYDVVDADHRPGCGDPSIRPNQIFAVGGLPFAIVHGDDALRIVATVERELLTPVGLRSLSPANPAYRGRYEGGVVQRDSAYHQGTVWPWLIGPFVDAWLNVNGDDAARRAEARRRFLAPLLAQLELVGLGHVFEIADGDAPHAARGCPFQAWSLGELIRAMARTAPQVGSGAAPQPAG